MPSSSSSSSSSLPSSSIQIPYSTSSIKFFKVTSRTEKGTVDMVAIYPNGSMACTHPGYANYGLPSKIIMALFITGEISINVAMHLHPMYLKDFVKQLSTEEKLKLTIVRDRESNATVDIGSDASWDFAKRETEDRWIQVGHGGAEYEAIVRPTANEIRTHPDSVAEAARKELLFLGSLIKYDETWRVRFFEFTGLIRSQLASEALNTAAAHRMNCGLQSIDPPVAVAKPSMVVATAIGDRCKKRKSSDPDSKPKNSTSGPKPKKAAPASKKSNNR
jgi:hypothetical protein